MVARMAVIAEALTISGEPFTLTRASSGRAILAAPPDGVAATAKALGAPRPGVLAALVLPKRLLEELEAPPSATLDEVDAPGLRTVAAPTPCNRDLAVAPLRATVATGPGFRKPLPLLPTPGRGILAMAVITLPPNCSMNSFIGMLRIFLGSLAICIPNADRNAEAVASASSTSLSQRRSTARMPFAKRSQGTRQHQWLSSRGERILGRWCLGGGVCGGFGCGVAANEQAALGEQEEHPCAYFRTGTNDTSGSLSTLISDSLQTSSLRRGSLATGAEADFTPPRAAISARSDRAPQILRQTRRTR
jgi:hypothetical protein